MSLTVKYDGSWLLPVQQGPTTRAFLLDTRSYIYTQKFQQLATKYVALAISSAGPGGSFLINETEPQHIGGGIVEWVRNFACRPPQRIEFEHYPHSYQAIRAFTVVELTVPRRSKIVIDYVHTLDPESIVVRTAPRYLQDGASIIRIGEEIPEDATEFLAEDTIVTRWRANIWERRNRFVPVLDITTALP